MILYINTTSSKPINATIEFALYNTGYNPIKLSDWVLYFYDTSNNIICYQPFYLSNNDKSNIGVSESAYSPSSNATLSYGQFLNGGNYAEFNIVLYPNSQYLYKIYNYLNNISYEFYVQLEIYPTKSVTEELYCETTSNGNEYICSTSPIINP